MKLFAVDEFTGGEEDLAPSAPSGELGIWVIFGGEGIDKLECLPSFMGGGEASESALVSLGHLVGEVGLIGVDAGEETFCEGLSGIVDEGTIEKIKSLMGHDCGGAAGGADAGVGGIENGEEIEDATSDDGKVNGSAEGGSGGEVFGDILIIFPSDERATEGEVEASGDR
jgi:hypothetical protein